MSSSVNLSSLKQVQVTNCTSTFSYEWRIEKYLPQLYLSEDFCHPLFPGDQWFLRLDPPPSQFTKSNATVTIIPKQSSVPMIAVTLEWNDKIILRTMFDPSRQALSASYEIENGAEALIGASFCLRCNLYYPRKLLPTSSNLTLDLELKNFLTDSDNLKSTTDFKLIASDGNDFVSAHRLILAARSSYFRAMFSVDSKERQEGRVHLKSTSIDVLKKALRFIYDESKDFDNLSVIDAIELLKFADQYDFLQVKTALECYLATKLTPNSLPFIQQLISHINCEVLAGAVDRLQRNP